MDKLLQLDGEMQVGKRKTSINIDEELWKDFCIVNLKKLGNRKNSLVLESLIKQYIKENKGR